MIVMGKSEKSKQVGTLLYSDIDPKLQASKKPHIQSVQVIEGYFTTKLWFTSVHKTLYCSLD